MYTNTSESGLESLIVKWLVEHNGYEQGTATTSTWNTLWTRCACSAS